MGEKKNAYRVLVGKSVRQSPPGRPGFIDVDWRMILKCILNKQDRGRELD
jgi:hypothetical protein